MLEVVMVYEFMSHPNVERGCHMWPVMLPLLSHHRKGMLHPLTLGSTSIKLNATSSLIVNNHGYQLKCLIERHRETINRAIL